MHPSNFNLRNIPQPVMQLLKKKAQAEHTSVNSLILNLIEQAIGYSGKVKKPRFHDLDHLAGTWNEKEAKDFEKKIQSFEKIDEEFWL